MNFKMWYYLHLKKIENCLTVYHIVVKNLFKARFVIQDYVLIINLPAYFLSLSSH